MNNRNPDCTQKDMNVKKCHAYNYGECMNVSVCDIGPMNKTEKMPEVEKVKCKTWSDFVNNSNRWTMLPSTESFEKLKSFCTQQAEEIKKYERIFISDNETIRNLARKIDRLKKEKMESLEIIKELLDEAMSLYNYFPQSNSKKPELYFKKEIDFLSTQADKGDKGETP